MNGRCILLLLATLLNLATKAQYNIATPISPDYDVLWGDTIPDPYRWMETPESDSLNEWLNAQRKIKDKLIGAWNATYTDAYQELKNDKYLSYPTLNRSGSYFFYLGLGEEGTPILYYKDNYIGESKVAYDPNKYIKYNNATIRGYELSKKGNYLAVGESTSGSDRVSIKVLDFLNSKKVIDVIVDVIDQRIMWWGDGFFYEKFKSFEKNDNKFNAMAGMMIYYHKVGDKQENDILILGVKEEINATGSFYIIDSNLILTYPVIIKKKICNTVSYINLRDGMLSQRRTLIISTADELTDYQVVGNQNNKFLILTNLKAPNYRVLAYHKDTVNVATEFVPEYKETLKSFQYTYGLWTATYFYNGSYSMFAFNSKGEPILQQAFTKYSGIDGFYPGPFDSTIIYYERSFFSPPVGHIVNLYKGTNDIIKTTQVKFSPELYTTKYVEYKSKDGTLIPMYLTYKKSIDISAPHPVMLYGYGGFGVSITPFLAYENILLYDNDFILAVPLIRGGGELGSDWHKDGMLLNKQNSYDDFIAAAEYLQNNAITTPEQTVIRGGSNGGLLVGVILTQRPDLFKVAIAQMGAFDMLRFQKFTVGSFHTREFGSVNNPIEYANLKSYSPLHNINDSTNYPALLMYTDDSDDRVPPFHSYKFLATLQHKTLGKNPHVLYLYKDAGHYGAQSLNADLAAKAYMVAFIFRQLHLNLMF